MGENYERGGREWSTEHGVLGFLKKILVHAFI
jgi:hypothetical protein